MPGLKRTRTGETILRPAVADNHRHRQSTRHDRDSFDPQCFELDETSRNHRSKKLGPQTLSVKLLPFLQTMPRTRSKSRRESVSPSPSREDLNGKEIEDHTWKDYLATDAFSDADRWVKTTPKERQGPSNDNSSDVQLPPTVDSSTRKERGVKRPLQTCTDDKNSKNGIPVDSFDTNNALEIVNALDKVAESSPDDDGAKLLMADLSTDVIPISNLPVEASLVREQLDLKPDFRNALAESKPKQNEKEVMSPTSSLERPSENQVPRLSTINERKQSEQTKDPRKGKRSSDCRTDDERTSSKSANDTDESSRKLHRQTDDQADWSVKAKPSFPEYEEGLHGKGSMNKIAIAHYGDQPLVKEKKDAPAKPPSKQSDELSHFICNDEISEVSKSTGTNALSNGVPEIGSDTATNSNDNRVSMTRHGASKRKDSTAEVGVDAKGDASDKKLVNTVDGEQSMRHNSADQSSAGVGKSDEGLTAPGHVSPVLIGSILSNSETNAQNGKGTGRSNALSEVVSRPAMLPETSVSTTAADLAETERFLVEICSRLYPQNTAKNKARTRANTRSMTEIKAEESTLYAEDLDSPTMMSMMAKEARAKRNSTQALPKRGRKPKGSLSDRGVEERQTRAKSAAAEADRKPPTRTSSSAASSSSSKEMPSEMKLLLEHEVQLELDLARRAFSELARLCWSEDTP